MSDPLLAPLPFRLDDIPVREFYPLPDYVEGSIGPRQAELCLFWSQAEGDALAGAGVCCAPSMEPAAGMLPAPGCCAPDATRG